ncbi:PREDICTED: apoptosis-inducing factor 2 isoform X4 [Gavialis gangeticus]|uniref:apoptosis-inducing factor 2 isoform X4 n=1 Tax=Gavialis gangeticus TaxID=94835 RepID=UPI00092FB00B|nr:PREDICTED: apoptosis-inducing factor 2 isoform X4 [Gavialis gangeticus]
MGSKLSVDDSVCVVIVGGGFGGIAAASQLKSWGIPFILVDMRDAFHHNVAALRASVESGFAKKTFISYSVSFGSSFRQAKVVGIDLEKTQVLLNDGKEISYSHLILATGSDGPFPGKFNQIIDMEAAIHTYEDMVKEIQKSSRIVVVGGGAAGVEMAAEIKTEYPAKECFLPEEVGISVAMKSLTMADSQCLLFIKARPGAALSNLTAHCPTVLAAGSDWRNCLQPFHWSSPSLLPYSAFVPGNAYCRPATYLRLIYCFVSQQAEENMLITLHIKGLFLVLSDTFSSLDTVYSYFYVVSTDHSHSFKNGTC